MRSITTDADDHTDFCSALCATTEREIASGQCGVGCRGCYRIMTPLVEPFRLD
jgi:hypothetical protein